MSSGYPETVTFRTESGSIYHLTGIDRVAGSEHKLVARLVRRTRRVGVATMWAADVTFSASSFPLTGVPFSATLVGNAGPSPIETSMVTEVS